MMRNVNDLRGYAIRATDGVIGTVDDFYFDDQDWGIRYLVVETTRAANIYVLVAGSNKTDALHHVLTGVPDPSTYPAAGLRLTKGTLIWWVARDAEHEHACWLSGPSTRRASPSPGRSGP